ncbi:MAG: acyltransferase [Sphingomonas bacterium]|uniref:acyltransferase family protein n=1 Tax=Sphingomonas bacterium TaxID=1895847 RepID=UPI0026205479|nr:acyltransferase [Sphingomonas bacterium]MDB5705960.1 acyltransferase [Sphingomonas bacterium]
MSLFDQPPRPGDGRLHVIDLARGLAAFAVLFYHYQFFFYTEPVIRTLTPAESQSEPFYPWLSLLYDHGNFAVQFFWLLSGFVFAAVYVSRHTRPREFIVGRVARLYPLHLLTLCVVAVLQAISIRMTGQFQIYPKNDAYHFVLNLFFASFWGLQKGPSFNAPIWSVSVEILVYGLFWVTLPYLYRRGVLGPVALAAVAWVAAFLIPGHLPLLRECAFYFFTGAAAFLLFRHWRSAPTRLFASAALLGIAGTVVLVAVPTNFAMLALGVPSVLTGVLLACCGIEATPLGKHAERTEWIGDATYGTYLWHIPIIIVILLVFSRVPGANSMRTEPWFLVSFLAAVMIVARISFVWFEHPIRERLNKYRRPRKSRAFSGEPSSPPPHLAPRSD